MPDRLSRLLLAAVASLTAVSCGSPSSDDAVEPEYDLLIRNGLVFEGDPGTPPTARDVAIVDDRIVLVGDAGDSTAQRTIDAAGRLVTAGFIDPHTHSGDDLRSPEHNANLNYLTQGVTTVVNGNDGGGAADALERAADWQAAGMGTNSAFFVGHGSVRRAVMGGDNRPPTADELVEMCALVERAMQNGALGLSTGLYYTPGNFADTDEVVELARVAARYGGIYDTHLRDESSYSIGLIAAVEETLEIGRRAGIPVHFAHLKALGVDVWGESETVIDLVRAALAEGLVVTADQYPWSASGTRLHNALLPRDFLDGEADAFVDKLGNADTRAALTGAVIENLRRRGGAESILFVDAKHPGISGKTLAEVALEREQTDIEAAFEILRQGSVRIASFNMHEDDIRAFMVQPWVVTSSDGTDGHPRKYASFPRKYQRYVRDESLLTLEEFLYRSSAMTADALGIERRGRIRPDWFADIVVIDLAEYTANADFRSVECPVFRGPLRHRQRRPRHRRPATDRTSCRAGAPPARR